MNRREFLQRMFTAGLVVAAPKIIFDLGANSYKEPEFMNEWKWVNPENPMGRTGYFITDIEVGLTPKYLILSFDQYKRLENLLPQD